MSRAVLYRTRPRGMQAPLSADDLEIHRLRNEEGLSTKQIAERLKKSPATVQNAFQRIALSQADERLARSMGR